jgi:hypothetical protein
MQLRLGISVPSRRHPSMKMQSSSTSSVLQTDVQQRQSYAEAPPVWRRKFMLDQPIRSRGALLTAPSGLWTSHAVVATVAYPPLAFDSSRSLSLHLSPHRPRRTRNPVAVQVSGEQTASQHGLGTQIHYLLHIATATTTTICRPRYHCYSPVYDVMQMPTRL